jgi:hypothetical protein
MTSQPAYTTETPPVTPKKIAAVAAARGQKTAARPAELPGRPVSPAAGITVVQTLTDPRLPGVEITLELITPELAESYLAKRPNSQSKIKQRTESPKTTERYIGDMLAEQWLFTGDPVRFNTLGEMFDGQHRLISIQKSGMPQLTIVIRGLDPETFVVFDTGRARSFPDVLNSMDVANVSIVAGVTRQVAHWRRGNYGVANIGRIPNAPWLGVGTSPTVLLETFTELRLEISAASRRGGTFKAAGFATKTAPPATVALAYLILSRIDLDRCEKFFHELQKGPAQVGPEYPPFVLRERLKKRLPEHARAAPGWVWLHFFFTTWNKWVEGASMGPLKTPNEAKYQYMALPIDPHAADRPDGWEPLGGIAG